MSLRFGGQKPHLAGSYCPFQPHMYPVRAQCRSQRSLPLFRLFRCLRWPHLPAFLRLPRKQLNLCLCSEKRLAMCSRLAKDQPCYTITQADGGKSCVLVLHQQQPPQVLAGGSEANPDSSSPSPDLLVCRKHVADSTVWQGCRQSCLKKVLQTETISPRSL